MTKQKHCIRGQAVVPRKGHGLAEKAAMNQLQLRLADGIDDDWCRRSWQY